MAGQASEPVNIDQELERLRSTCYKKYHSLFRRAQSNQLRRRHLQTASGVMALLSGLVASAIFTELLGNPWIKIFTALLAFGSGSITLFISNYASGKEGDEMFKGSTQFEILRGEIMIRRAAACGNPTQLHAAYVKLWAEYGTLSGKYDHLLLEKEEPEESFQRKGI